MPTLKRPRAVMEAADKEFVADTLAQTKGLGDTIGTLPDARDTTEGIKQGMTLIDRFYNGGNQARPGVADILVTVLDQVIGRMRQRNANAQATIDRCNEECATLDKAIGLAHTYVPGPPCGTYVRPGASVWYVRAALYAPEAQGSSPRGATHCTHAVPAAAQGTPTLTLTLTLTVTVTVTVTVTGHRQDRGQVRAVARRARDEEGEGGGAAQRDLTLGLT